MRYYANHAINSQNHKSNARYPGGPIIWSDEIRAFAWRLRNIADAAYYLPDKCEYKEYFMRVIDHNLKSLDSMKDIEPHNVNLETGYIMLATANVAQGAEYDYNLIRTSPWQYDYVVWAIQRAIDHGAQGGRIARDLILQFLLEPAYNEVVARDWNPRHLTSYRRIVGKQMKVGGEFVWFSWKEQFVHDDDYLRRREPVWSYGHSLRMAAVVAKKADKPWADKAHKFLWDMLTEKRQLGAISSSDLVYGQYALAYHYN